MSAHIVVGTARTDERDSQDETSEQIIGEWMELRGVRDQMVIATKVRLP